MTPHDITDGAGTSEGEATRWWQRLRRRPADLLPGQRAVVTSVACDTAVGQRMLHLGVLEGTEVELVRRAPAGDPLEIRLAGSALSVRATEARMVAVEVRR